MEDLVLQMNEDGSAEFMEDPTEVLAEEYSHTANLAEILDDSILGELSSELGSSFEDDLESRSEWEEALTKGLGLLGINYEDRDEPFVWGQPESHTSNLRVGDPVSSTSIQGNVTSGWSCTDCLHWRRDS